MAEPCLNRALWVVIVAWAEEREGGREALADVKLDQHPRATLAHRKR